MQRSELGNFQRTKPTGSELRHCGRDGHLKKSAERERTAISAISQPWEVFGNSGTQENTERLQQLSATVLERELRWIAIVDETEATFRKDSRPAASQDKSLTSSRELEIVL